MPENDPDYDQSPLPCRCYFIGRLRVYADCLEHHEPKPFDDDERDAVIAAYLALDDYGKARVGCWLIGAVAQQATQNGYRADSLREEVAKWPR